MSPEVIEMDDITTDGLRAQAYTGLALAFDRPDDELFEVLECGELAGVLQSIGDTIGADDLVATGTALEDMEIDPVTLRKTYARVFGLEADSGIPLYEVGYAPGSLLTNTDIMADIAGFYRAFGLSTQAESRDRVDALSTQLEYLGFLALRRAQYLEAADEESVEIVTDATATFLEDHLGRWVARLVLDILDVVEEPTYRTLADALGALVEADLARYSVEPAVYQEVPTAPLASVAGFDPEAGRMDLGCGANVPPTNRTMEVDQ